MNKQVFAFALVALVLLFAASGTSAQQTCFNWECVNWNGSDLTGLIGKNVTLVSKTYNKYIVAQDARPWWNANVVLANGAVVSTTTLPNLQATWKLIDATPFSSGSISGWRVTLNNMEAGFPMASMSGINTATASSKTVSWQQIALITTGNTAPYVNIYAVHRPGYEQYAGYSGAYAPSGGDGLFSGTQVGTNPVTGDANQFAIQVCNY